jgi:V8-like Glu-specific endopeptidase
VTALPLTGLILPSPAAAVRLVGALTLAGCILLPAVTAGVTPGIARTERTLQPDLRVIADRLDPAHNPDHRDEAFLNAVGAVWPYAISKTGAGYAASTGERAASGFLIDRCHVLTNLHVAYGEADVVDPPLAEPVAFAVGQTGSERDRGALQGLKYLLAGTVIAHGDAMVLDGLVHRPEDDWALIRLDLDVDRAITPMPIAAVEPALLPRGLAVSSAGYPSDHRERRGDGFKLKDLWTSAGEVVEVMAGPTGALIESTLQTTAGNSGGPLFADLGGRRHLVIGMVQSVRGNGIDATAATPNVQLLFTAGTIARITAAQAQNPCP